MQEDLINGKRAPLSGGMPPERGATSDPKVLARATRRQFTAEYKAEIVRRADAWYASGRSIWAGCAPRVDVLGAISAAPPPTPRS